SVLAVGSVNAARVRSAFSSRGPTYDGRIKPDVMAMGQSTVFQSAFGNIVSGSGTSFSAPLVSGLVACLLQAAPYAAGYAVHQAVVRSADRFLQPDNEYGYGIPNGFEALKIVSALNPEPVWPGDADLDGRVQTGDVYLTASAYGRTGPARSVAGALWQPYPAPEGWNTVSHVRGRVVNDRYLDANGDGSVNLFDLALVVSRQGFVR
ncbi:MAG: S8 family serine peptidase, partial [Bacteroidia bacterium]|nr:S8 family serine peptidase [Bacteroidia bacterium]MDW8335044.1 S8 family serine peptidase [Bacteroidia bacterium]